ncbi:di-heme oxidoredictase family protein [uncultured Thalassolituus sp.]|uniref:di-heme oxidoreductase family protein n=1 Tax=uncultured Thalassolituus sp. TaxID=285273 RepID=UPI002617F2DC|nr:di-heme oxidoredictase family protein [uncultured Thalassolituus sp.]
MKKRQVVILSRQPKAVTDRMLSNFKPALCRLSAFILIAFSLGCTHEPEPWGTLAQEHKPAGEATVAVPRPVRFDLPVPQLSDTQKPLFYAGRALAQQPWVKAPTATTQRDGLGPLFNARSCLACHLNGGRGEMPDKAGESLFTAFVRISVSGLDEHEGANPEPVYGTQIQNQSVSLSSQLGIPPQPGELQAEAHVSVRWLEEKFRYPDGHETVLRKPEIVIRDLSNGPLQSDTMMSLRNAPGMYGMGLLAAIPEQSLDALADPQDKNSDGISGRRNQVWDPVSQSIRAGRFGLKANRPDLPVIVAAAFAHDIGITNALFPHQPCTQAQPLCLKQPDGNDEEGTELSNNLLNMTVNFVRDSAVPASRLGEQHIAGRQVFYDAGCQQCHQPSFVTAGLPGAEYLGQQTIWPYTDLLLHDMGPGLADGRPDFLATGSEWRTAPLWGLGLQRKVTGGRLSLLHDGRARSVEEAVLWHGGEAAAARNYFIQLPMVQRRELEIFVEAL